MRRTIRRVLPFCIAIGCSVQPLPLAAQTSSAPLHVGDEVHSHKDVQAVAPAPPQIFEGALTALAAELRKVQMKSGTLDVEGLIAAIRPGWQEMKLPERLELVSSARCHVVDAQDRGGYWTGPTVAFLGGDRDKDYAVEKILDGDWKSFSLAKPPVIEIKYVLTYGAFDEGSDRPFRRNVRVRAEYDIVARVTVTFDQKAITITRESQPVASGAASKAPKEHTFLSTIALVDGSK